MSSEETVTISKEIYEYLIHSEKWLSHLEECGMQDWCGYETATETFGKDG